jgi:Cu(I)/Ag(I) efflux system membrane fusion protein
MPLMPSRTASSAVGVPIMEIAKALLCAAICCVLVPSSGRSAIASAAAETRREAHYQCPMHPSFVQDRKGNCPVCGMKLVLVKPATQGGARAQDARDVEVAPAQRGAGPVPGAGPSPHTMAISADQQRVLGVRVSTVQKTAGTRTLRVLGRVAPDEARLYRLNAGIDGSIRDVAAFTTGSRVKKDDVLATFYAPNALSVIQIYILNLAGHDRTRQRESEGSVEGQSAGAAFGNIQQRTMQLENLGVSALQREEIKRTRAIPDAIEILAPSDGFILARNVSPGLKFDRGMEFYRIADLRRVWILADVFPHDAQHVRPGMRANVSVPEQRITLPATVRQILQFDAATRTLKVKLEVDNPGYVLRPDMFVDVGLTVSLAPAVAVPADAIVDSGLAKTVFVHSGEGVFEARRVETGWRSGDQVEVVKGLSPGEQIVTSGTFFLDSESRMRTR